MVIEDLEHVLAPLKLLGLMHSFALGGAENFGITTPRQLPSITPWANPTKFHQLTHPETGYKLCKFFCENCARDTPLQPLYSTFWSNLSKNFGFGGPIPLSLHQWGWNLAWRSGPSVPSSMPVYLWLYVNQHALNFSIRKTESALN